ECWCCIGPVQESRMTVRPFNSSKRPAPIADWSNVSDGNHAVQFYGTDDALIRLLSRYVGTALVSGHGAVVIATPQHRVRLAADLLARGLDIEVPRRQGHYVPLDAASTLEKLTRHGLLNVQPLADLAGALIAQVGGR